MIPTPSIAKSATSRSGRANRSETLPIMPSLPDILEADLELVFVGINPGTYSAEVGHYYARTTNLFWPMLYESGLIPKALQPEDDWKLVRLGIGLTDVVKRSSDRASDLAWEEFDTGATVVRNKIAMWRPKVVCFNGLTAFRALFGRKDGPGAKPDRIGESRVFVVPSTSRRNAAYSREVVLFWFKELRTFVKTG
ncbi:MAG: mismatch-specific DNA-glycosylase [Nitrospirae bacterium]|nr:mismatch-specific DNA-glycosylase [Candidatus Manganitrophaceae bacterium]